MEVMMIYAQMFFGWLLQTTLIASLVICLILLIQKLLGGRLGPRWSYALWLVLLIRMVLPLAPSSRLSLSNLVPSWDRQIQRIQSYEVTEQQGPSGAGQTSGTAEAIPAQKPESDDTIQKRAIPQPGAIADIQNESQLRLFSFRRVLPVLWLAGAAVVGTYLLVSNFSLWRIVKRDRPLVNQSILELFEECKSLMGVQSLVVVVPSSQIRSPGLFGFVRPRLLLPREMLDTATRQELQYVFLHELAHLKRRDIYLGWLMSLLQVLHWFNPLVWFAFYRMRADRELACDALVLIRTGQDKSQEYGGAIVELVRRFSRSRPLPAMAGVIESKSQLKRRIAMITKFRNKSYCFSPLAVVLIVILAFISLPDAKRSKASEVISLQPVNQPKFTKIQIPTEISWDMRLSPEGKRISLVSDNKIWIMPLSGQLGPAYPGAPKELDTEGVLVEKSGHAWSADGQWIAFNEYVPEKEFAERKKGYQGIYLVSSGGGKPKKIHETYRDQRTVNYRISLSPEGKTLAFSSVDIKSEEQYIYTIAVDGGQPKRLVDFQSREPVFSPNGKMIAFVEDRRIGRGGGDLWAVASEGGRPIHIAEAEYASSPIWSPQGDMIAFLDKGDRAKKINVVIIDDSGRPVGEVISIDAPKDIAGVWLLAGWGSNDKLCAIFETSVEQGLFTVPVEGGKAMQVVQGGGTPRWAPDGERIFCISTPKENEGTWRGLAIGSFPAEGGTFSSIPLKSNRKMRIPSFGAGSEVSPDGKTVVFSGKTQTRTPVFLHNNIWTVQVEGGAPTQLTEATEGTSHMFPCWSPDGKTIAFIYALIPDIVSAVSDVKADIYTIQADGGKPMALTSHADGVNFGPIAWSPDGNYIAYYSEVDEISASAKLKIISTDADGEPQSIGSVDQPHPGKEFAWSPDSKRVAFDGPDGKVITIMSVKDGSTVKIETNLINSDMGSQLDWSPDGETFVFVGGKGEKPEFWTMENFLPEAMGK